MPHIIERNPKTLLRDAFQAAYSGAIILTTSNQLLLQQRTETTRSFPGYLAMFGGRIEDKETPTQAIIRELHEELGALIDPDEVIFLGALTESISNHQDLIYEFFWHDKTGKITGCFEDTPAYFDTLDAVYQHPKPMKDIFWSLKRCQTLGIL